MDDVTEFAKLFQQFMQRMTEMAWSDRGPTLKELVDEFLGLDCATIPVVSESFPAYDHVNIQVAVTAFLDNDGRRHQLLGLTGQSRHFVSFSDLVQQAHHMGIGIGPVTLDNLPIGPDETLACVSYGMYLIDDNGRKAAVLMRGPDDFGPTQAVSLEVVTADSDHARALLAEIRALSLELNVFRGQVLSFGEPHMGRFGAGPVLFLRRPEVERDDIVMDAGVLEMVERQIFGIAEHRDRLRASGQHVKRGLLMHGPPGCGKTLTIRYLVSRMREHTVVVLTGGSLHMIRPACALARLLEPSVVVLEDVDLVAEERGMMGSTSVLFDLLNEMDGMAGEADVAFLLTTNRADLLEPALAARPGRVDLAVEVNLPGEDARRRLLELYARGLELRVQDMPSIVARTEGVTASFIKELMRKSALRSAETTPGTGRISIADTDVNAALDELLEEGNVLTRVLLGGETADPDPSMPQPGRGWMVRRSMRLGG